MCWPDYAARVVGLLLWLMCFLPYDDDCVPAVVFVRSGQRLNAAHLNSLL
jgi:hypothetical protein